MMQVQSGQHTKHETTLRDERDLARLLITRCGHSLGQGDYYYRVTRIAKDLAVSPDVDLLKVYVNPWHPEENRAIAFELKVLKVRKYRGDHSHVELGPFYQGIGQVLTYFHHGIDRAMLVVGLHANTYEHPDAARDAEDALKAHGMHMKASIFRNFPYLEIVYIRNGSLERLLQNMNWDTARFPMSEATRLQRENIFRKQFVFEKLD